VTAPPLTAEEQRQLLALARGVLVAHFGGDKAAGAGPSLSMESSAGAFVTLRTRAGELRGCVGMMESEDPLAETVARMALAAARSDRRFDPLRADELPEVVIEISVLGPLREISPEEIEIGRDGLLVREGGRQGVLLPQVASEHGWSRETFLEKTCTKAGLPPGAWKRSGALVFAFAATVFGEGDLGRD
jgi:AmmeMemoRadiSam system protein A